MKAKVFFCSFKPRATYFSDNNFCANFVNYFETNDQLRFFWDTVKPLLLGKCYARIKQ